MKWASLLHRQQPSVFPKEGSFQDSWEQETGRGEERRDYYRQMIANNR